MRIKPGFELRNVCGEHIIVATGLENIDYSQLISLNESAAYLWDAVKDADFTADSLAQLLLKEYDVDDETARRDAAAIARQWVDNGLAQ